jgi:hypothetical protein
MRASQAPARKRGGEPNVNLGTRAMGSRASLVRWFVAVRKWKGRKRG